MVSPSPLAPDGFPSGLGHTPATLTAQAGDSGFPVIELRGEGNGLYLCVCQM